MYLIVVKLDMQEGRVKRNGKIWCDLSLLRIVHDPGFLQIGAETSLLLLFGPAPAHVFSPEELSML